MSPPSEKNFSLKLTAIVNDWASEHPVIPSMIAYQYSVNVSQTCVGTGTVTKLCRLSCVCM